MRAKDFSRIGLSLAIYVLFFALSAWAPHRWQPSVPPTSVPSVATLPAVLAPQCGLAVQPPPLLAHEWTADWKVPDPKPAERIALRVAIPGARLAGLGRTFADAISDRPRAKQTVPDHSDAPAPAESVGAANLEASLAPADGPAEGKLPPADVEPEVCTPPVNPSQWQRPTSLLAQLRKLAENPACADWASSAMEQIEGLTTEVPLSLDERQDLLARLSETARQADEVHDKLEIRTLATVLRRAQYSLERRLDIWRALHTIELRGVAEANQVRAEPGRLAWCLAKVMQMTEEGTGPKWRKYLLVDALAELTRQDAQPAASQQRTVALCVLERLDLARTRLPQADFITTGPFAALDDELRHWAAEPVAATALLVQLERYEETGLASAAGQVAAQARRLSFSPLVEHRDLGRLIDLHYRNCNVRVSINQEMLNRLLPAQEPATRPVRDTILGLPVRGESTTSTKLAVRLLESQSRMRLELSAAGVVDSATNSQRGSVTIFTNSHSHYSARKVVELGGKALVAEPAAAEALTQTRLRCIKTELDGVPLVGSLVQNYAKDQYALRREQARQEVQGKVEAQARQRIDALAQSRFEQLNQQFNERVMAPLERLKLQPSFVDSSTSDQRFTIRLPLAGDYQLAAHTPRPQALSDSLLSLQVHESALNNVIERLQLAGKTLTVAQLRDQLREQFNYSAPYEPSDSDDTVLTFAADDPVHARCIEGRLELSISLARLESGSRQWRNFVVHVNYRPQMAGNTVELVRDGAIGLAAERISIQSQLVLRGTFSRLFSEDRRFGLLNDAFANDPRLSGLQITQCVVDDGWIGLSIGPQRTSAAQPAMAR